MCWLIPHVILTFSLSYAWILLNRLFVCIYCVRKNFLSFLAWIFLLFEANIYCQIVICIIIVMTSWRFLLVFTESSTLLLPQLHWDSIISSFLFCSSWLMQATVVYFPGSSLQLQLGCLPCPLHQRVSCEQMLLTLSQTQTTSPTVPHMVLPSPLSKANC